ncbi:MAG: response regulator [Gemmatimonadetes bacterium]|nr:MAG: response regulator [Gemmatimonadota bacterium]
MNDHPTDMSERRLREGARAPEGSAASPPQGAPASEDAAAAAPDAAVVDRDETNGGRATGAGGPGEATGTEAAAADAGEGARQDDAAEPAEPAEAAAPGPPPQPLVVHWLVRIAERAALSGERPEVPPNTPARDAWGVVTRAYGVGEGELVKLVAEYFRLDVADFATADPNAVLVVPEAMARKHHIYPLIETDRHLFVATCDPTDVEAERALGFSTGRTTVFQVASPTAIQEALDARFSPEKAVETLLGTLEAEDVTDDAVKLVEEMGPESISAGDASATPVVKLTNLILRDGIAQGASDIHIEPGRKVGVVRYRVDGVLRKHMDLPMSAMNRVISRIKILSKLDIADRLRPQDGKARVRIRNLSYDLRVSTIPAGGAEKCVIRVLDSNRALTLEDLELPAYELERMRSLLGLRDGIVVVTGPTGSGKTTTLYGALREMADGKVNIMTVEDPIEYELPGLTQTQVETKQGLTFAAALRSILRQDPDVILVGEIRDKETAQTAAQAAMTGHLVLATVHANDAVSAVSRLADMGLQYSTIASTLRGALAQRLIRRVCAACAEPVRGRLTPEEQRLTEKHGIEPVVRAVGCAECGFTGYRGRLPVVEVLVAGPRFQAAIEARKGWQTLSRIAMQGGMRSLHQVALDWVTQARTTLSEVDRVLGAQMEDEGEDEVGPPRIMVVDDDEDARTVMAAVLEEEGYEVTLVASGEEALEHLQQDPDFHLVILDLSMPGMDGREVLARIRGSRDTQALPVLVRTGVGDEETEAEVLDSGADDYVDKDANPVRFLARVRAVLRRAVM